MTVYNRERYVASAIEAVLAQTFANFELIVVDDRSTDRSAAIAAGYARDPRVRVLVNDENLGDYPNRNRAATLASGRYLKYVDADDVIYPHCLQTMVDAMESFPEAALGISRAVPGIRSPAVLSRHAACWLQFGGSGFLDIGPLATVIRRSAFEKIGGFEPHRNTSDFECWLALASTAPTVVIAPGLIWWRRHAGQESQLLTANDAGAAVFAGRYLRIALDALADERCPLDAHEKSYARWRLLRTHAAHTLHMLKRGRLGLAYAWFREGRQPLRSLVTALRAASRPPAVAVVAQSRRSSGTFAVGVGRGIGAVRPLVSVVIPARNVEGRIAEVIQSVLDQSIPDWELVIGDDASDDRTAAIAERYADDDRIRVVRSSRRVGKWINSNRCADLARGRYLKFLHAGDRLYPRSLETLRWYVQGHADVVLFGAKDGDTVLLPQQLSPVDAYRHEYLAEPVLWESPSAMLYRHDAFQSCGGFDAMCASAPAKLHLQLARLGSVLLVPGGLVAYRRASRQGQHKQFPGLTYLLDDLAWLEDGLRHPQCPLSGAERAQAVTNLARRRREARWAQRFGPDATLTKAVLALGRLRRRQQALDIDGSSATFDRSLYPPRLSPWHNRIFHER